MDVIVLPEAEQQIRTIEDWWRENRPAAPALFTEELASAIELIARVPRFGRRCRHRAVSELRRVLLRATRYHVYYATSDDVQRIYVLAVWSAVRGSPPPIRRPS